MVQFSEFGSVSKNDWIQQAIKDLKGKNFDESLRWRLTDDIIIEPYYTSENINENMASALQAIQKQTADWQSVVEVVAQSPKETNRILHQQLNNSADAFILNLENISITNIDLNQLIYGIKLSDTPIFFKTNDQNSELIALLAQFIPYQMKGGLMSGGLSNWMRTGQLNANYFDDLAAIISKTHNSPSFKTVCISSSIFHQAGANMVQELAFTLAAAVAYLDQLTDAGIAAIDAIDNLFFEVSVGTNYFVEIAKIRALRYLWAKITATWLESDNTKACYILAQTSTYFDAAVTPNTNLLRATTEAMSAVLGGCDALHIHAHNAIFETPTDFSTRIATNISTILKEESHFDKTTDPAAGSYYIENLTLQLVDAAWSLFQHVEKQGGLMASFNQNFIQNEIELSYQQSLEKLQEGKSVMVGVNKFRHNETPFEKQKETPIIKQSDVKSLPNRRLSAYFE
jgi:methylmalonyl-CoA mutase